MKAWLDEMKEEARTLGHARVTVFFFQSVCAFHGKSAFGNEQK
jgi:hypothetical protein